MTTTMKFLPGDYAPQNEKAVHSPISLCFLCGRNLGANPFYYEMTTRLILIIPNSNDKDSQGCFPIGNECAKKFHPDLLVKLGA